jgi:hypothetical protein
MPTVDVQQRSALGQAGMDARAQDAFEAMDGRASIFEKDSASSRLGWTSREDSGYSTVQVGRFTQRFPLPRPPPLLYGVKKRWAWMP